MGQIAATLALTTDKKIIIGAVCSMVVGMLVSAGYVSPKDSSQLQQLFESVGGLIITTISIVYFFEHQMLNKKNELANQQQEITKETGVSTSDGTITTSVPPAPASTTTATVSVQ